MRAIGKGVTPTSIAFREHVFKTAVTSGRIGCDIRADFAGNTGRNDEIVVMTRLARHLVNAIDTR